MKRHTLTMTLAGVASLALLTGAAFAQGRGRGPGMGQGWQMGRCMSLGPGAGGGGWWTRVTPQTPEQKALVEQVTVLHTRIRETNREIALLRTQKADPKKIAEKEQLLTQFRAELQKVTTANSALLPQMGVPAGRGRGYGLRDGSGPNPDCPLKK